MPRLSPTPRGCLAPDRHLSGAARARAVAFGLLCSLGAWHGADAADAPLDIEFDPARTTLSVRVQDAALLDVLQAIAAKTGMKLIRPTSS